MVNNALESGLLSCKLCFDRGVILHGDVAVRCACVKQSSLRKLFDKAQIPLHIMNYTFDKFKLHYYSKDSGGGGESSCYQMARLASQSAKGFVFNYLENPNCDGLLLAGSVGSGKTFLASCIANALLDEGKEVLFVVVPDLLDGLKATYDSSKSGEYTEQEILDAAKKVGVLILDDLGAHNYTEWVRNKIYTIINYRLNYLLPTIVTTNLTPDDLETYLGERTTSRLVQMCQLFWLKADKDIRHIKNIEKGPL